MSKQDRANAVNAVIALITEAGFIADGHTATEHVRIPTVKNPVYGGIGGEPVTFGGRARYKHTSLDARVTVGPQTVNFYRVGPRKSYGPPDIISLGSSKTHNLERIRTILANLKE